MSSSFSPNELKLGGLLGRTVGQNVADITQAQQQLSHEETTMTQFGPTLLTLIHKILTQKQVFNNNSNNSSNSTNIIQNDPELTTCLAGSIYFRNYIRKRYPLFEGGVPDSDRDVIKKNLVQLLMGSPTKIQSQLSGALEEIAAIDFPSDWESLLPELKEHLRMNMNSGNTNIVGGQTNSDLSQSIHKRGVILEALDTIFKDFEDQDRSNELMRALKYVVDNFAKEHLDVTKLSFNQMMVWSNGLQNQNSTGGLNSNTNGLNDSDFIQRLTLLKLELRSCVACTKIFYALNIVDLPEFYEDSLSQWLDLFVTQGLSYNLPAAIDLIEMMRQQQSSSSNNNTSLFSNWSNEQKTLTKDIITLLTELWAKICDNLTLYTNRYQEEVGAHVPSAVIAVCELMVKLDGWMTVLSQSSATTSINQSNSSDLNQMSSLINQDSLDSVIASGIQFLSVASRQTWGQQDPFSNPNVLIQVCHKIIVPNIKLKQSDLEQLEDNPLDFLRRDLEDADQHTRRKTASDLVKSLLRLHEGPITNTLQTVMGELLSSNQNQNQVVINKQDDNAVQTRECCVYLAIALANKGQTRQSGCTIINPSFQESRVNEYFTRFVVPILQIPIPKATDTNTDPESPAFCALRAASLKYLTTFRTKLTDLKSCLPLLQQHVLHPDPVVHTYAAFAFERILSTRELTVGVNVNSNVNQQDNGGPSIFGGGGLGGQTTIGGPQTLTNTVTNANSKPPLFSPQEIKPSLLSILEPMLVTLSSKQGIEQNEYLMRAICRILNYLRKEASEIAMIMLEQLTLLLGQIATNPGNPYFSHNLFEAMAAVILVSSSSQNQGNSQVESVESKLYSTCKQILESPHTDFFPYVFQILGLLLDQQSSSASSVYIELFAVVINQEAWKTQANVPGLIRLLKAYFAKHSQSATVGTELANIATNPQNLSQIMQRTQSILSHRKAEHVIFGFDVLKSVFGLLPYKCYQEMFPGILNMIFQVFDTSSSGGKPRQGVAILKRGLLVSLMIFVYKANMNGSPNDSLNSNDGANLLFDTLEKLRPNNNSGNNNLFKQVWENLCLPAIESVLDSGSSGIDPQQVLSEKKIVALSIVKLILHPKFPPDLMVGTVVKLMVLLGLIRRQTVGLARKAAAAANSVNNGSNGLGVNQSNTITPGVGEAVDEFTGSFSRLANAEFRNDDYAKDCKDYIATIKGILQPFRGQFQTLASNSNKDIEALVRFLS